MFGVIGDQLADVWVDNTTVADADQNGNTLLVSTNRNPSNLYAIDLGTKGYASNPGSSMVMPFVDIATSVLFVSSTKALCTFSGSHNTPVLFDLTTGAATTLSAGLYGANRQQAIAVDQVNHKAICLQYIGSQFMVVDTLSNTVTTVSPSFMSTGNALSVIKKSGANANFLIAMSDGRIVETDPTGVTINTLMMPAAYSDGFSTDKTTPDQMAMFGDDLYIAVTSGAILHYTYSTDTFLDQVILGGSSNITAGSQRELYSLGTIVNGLLPAWSYSTSGQASVMLFLARTGLPLMEIDEISTLSGNPIVKAGINATASVLWICWDNGRVSIFDLPASGTATETTRIQDPAGVDASGRIIRLPYFGQGMSSVESDTPITAGVSTLSAQFEDLDYIEVALDGSGVSEKSDVRVFQA